MPLILPENITTFIFVSQTGWEGTPVVTALGHSLDTATTVITGPAQPRLQHPCRRHRRLSHWIICALKIWHPPFPPPTLSISYPVLSTTATFFMFPWFGCSRVPSEEIINFDIKAKIHKIACQWWRSLRTSAQFYVERHCSSAFFIAVSWKISKVD